MTIRISKFVFFFQKFFFEFLSIFNAAQPGVGRVHVLGSKKTKELLFGSCIKDKQRLLAAEAGGSCLGDSPAWGYPDKGTQTRVPRPGEPRPGILRQRIPTLACPKLGVPRPEVPRFGVPRFGAPRLGVICPEVARWGYPDTRPSPRLGASLRPGVLKTGRYPRPGVSETGGLKNRGVPKTEGSPRPGDPHDQAVPKTRGSKRPGCPQDRGED